MPTVKPLRTTMRFAAALGLIGLAAAFRAWLVPLLGFDSHDGALLVVTAVASILLGLWPAILVILAGSVAFEFLNHGHLPRTGDELARFLILFGEGVIIVAAIEL